jgi:tripartite-type tricarboxylate transporter receptor subunit TctC
MQGILVPAGTPKAIAALLEREITAIIATPDVKAKMLAIGIEPEGITSEAFAAYIKAEIAKWKKVIADAKIGQI